MEVSREKSNPKTLKSIPPQHNSAFYLSYQKAHIVSYHLACQIKQMNSIKQELWVRLLNYQKKSQEEFKDQIRGEAPEKKKRFRRTADEIQKKYWCTANGCQRCYGSQGSLIQHMKLKHPDIEREVKEEGHDESV